MNADSLFTASGIAHLHDAVLDGCGLSLEEPALKALFIRLPESIQRDALVWGLGDTPVMDAVCVWARESSVEVKAIGEQFGRQEA